MAKTFGMTWWGRQWLNALSHIDYSNRLPRGASYARNGMVSNITVRGNEISAQVRGSSPRPYSVSIIVPEFSATQRKMLVDDIMSMPSLLSKLLNRELPQQLATLAEASGIKLFPRSWNDFHMKCSCPDWAVPCKHLAAVIYKLSQEIDNNPFLVFAMHGFDLQTELKKRGVMTGSGGVMSLPSWPEEALSPVPQWMVAGGEDEANAPFQYDYTLIPELLQPLDDILTPSPAFCGDCDFRNDYATERGRLAKESQRVVDGKKPLWEALSVPPPAILDRGSDESEARQVSLAGIPASFSLVLDEETDASLLVDGGKKKKQPDLASVLSVLHSVRGNQMADLTDHQRTLLFASQSALQLISRGAIVPRLVMLKSVKTTGRKKAQPSSAYTMLWLPALLNDSVRRLTARLQSCALPIVALSEGGSLLTGEPIASQGLWLLAALVSFYVRRFSASRTIFLYHSLFFHSGYKTFDGIGERETPGGIHAWISRYHMTAGKWQMVILAEDKGDCFDLSLRLHNTEKADDALGVSMREFMSAKAYAADRMQVLQQLAVVSSFIPQLDDYVNEGGLHPIAFSDDEIIQFLQDVLPAIVLLHVRVVMPKSLRELLRPRSTVKISTSSAVSASSIHIEELFCFDWMVALGDEIVSYEDFLALTNGASQLLRFKGEYIYVTPEDIARLNKEEQATRMSKAQLLQAAISGEWNGAKVELTPEARAIIRQLTDETPVAVPQSLHATLRPYQERGYSWMYRNARIGMGSILADDMGLGKTIQTIALLLQLKEEGAMEKERTIIVAPTGLLANWQAEIARFAPSLSVMLYHGANRTLEDFDSDILLTSYGLLRSDIDKLKKKKWLVAVIDEAQNIKNPSSGQSKAVRSLRAATHIALSGTPVENRLSDYWSVMDFANKGYLGTQKSFADEYVKPIQVMGNERQAAHFRRITAPFMMRRLKTDRSIITDLPEKMEQNITASLTARQAALYKSTLDEAMRTIEGMGDEEGNLFKRQGLILQMILALKQICNHPAQYLKNDDWDPALSGKVELLLDLLRATGDAGEKVLVFTQFTEMGSHLQDIIAERTGYRPLFLHGGCSLKQRQQMVDEFQNSPSQRVFLLSIKAAGTGLNLTAASHVVHFDLWWNPAVEAQATDRAYRIGQKKNVMVYRFITHDTFEERIDRMIQDKKRLADMTVATGESWIGKLSNEELRDLFR